VDEGYGFLEVKDILMQFSSPSKETGIWRKSLFFNHTPSGTLCNPWGICGLICS
jgi:hypothetical protein